MPAQRAKSIQAGRMNEKEKTVSQATNGPSAKAQQRKDRSAVALRRNLQERKRQTRARASEKAEKPSPGGR